MTTFILSPAATWAAATSSYRTPLVMMEQGLLKAHSERENGTTRHLDLCPVGSTRRDTAEWISEQVDEGVSVKALARELHISVATVRRFLLSLELTEEIEAQEWEALSFDQDGDPVWDDSTDPHHNIFGYTTQQGHELTEGAFAPPCESTGTTAEDLVADLEASLAAHSATA